MRMTAMAIASMLAASAAFAQDTTTTIKKQDGLFGSTTTVEKKTEPSVSSSTTVESTGAVGCSTEVKQKTNEYGDTKTTKKTEC